MKFDAQQQKAIFDRFNSDSDFRKRALEDANKAVKEEFGIDLPFPVRVASDGTSYWVEPVMNDTDGLSDEQLELAAGGKGGGGPSPQQFRMPIFGRGAGIISACGGN